jgi:hypothetical protein
MKNTRFRKPLVDQPLHLRQVEFSPLAATGQHPIPAFGNGPECHEGLTVGQDRVVVEVATNDVPQPLPLCGNRVMHTPPHLLFDHPQLRPHEVPSGLPFDLEFALASFAVAPSGLWSS